MNRSLRQAGWLAAVLSLSFGSAEAQLLGQTTWYPKGLRVPASSRWNKD